MMGTNDDMGGMAKITRIGRMYKLVKLTRLVRIIKILKARSKLLNYLQQCFNISAGFERLFIFTMGFFLMCHIVSCLWTMTGQFKDDDKSSWISDYKDYDTAGMYMVSFYFTVTTITTVGYGDILPTTRSERLFCIFIMILGVVSFSFATGSLSSIL